MFRLPVSPAFPVNNMTVTLQTSNFFAPYAAVTIRSILDHISPEYNYDILVTAWDMKDSTERQLVLMAEGLENVSLRVVDVSREIKPYQDFAKKRRDYERFSATGVVRLMLPSLLENYDTVLNLDCDTLVRADVAELLQCDLSDYCMGGVPDMIYYSIVNFVPSEEKYITDKVFNKLKLEKLTDYVNAGLLLLNLKKIRQEHSQEEIMAYAVDGDNFYRCYEQDTFNGLFRGEKLKLAPEWNFFVDGDDVIDIGEHGWSPNDEYLTNYHNAEERVKIYHFVGQTKPWQSATQSFSREWWGAARRTPFLDTILSRNESANITVDHEYRDKAAKEKRVLFYCETPCQLMTAVNIKLHYYPLTPSDLLASDTDVMRALEESIERAGVFQSVIWMKYDTEISFGRLEEKSARETVAADRIARKSVISPEICQYTPALKGQYTDYYLAAVESYFGVMTFYNLASQGTAPAVHIFDKGVSSYTDDASWIANGMIWSRDQREGQRFGDHIQNIFLYYPELYTAFNGVPAVPIPQFDILPPDHTGLLDGLFGRYALPKQKYLFLDECFVDERLLANDIELLDIVGEMVGKENIAVFLHPHSMKKEPLYKLHGYEVFRLEQSPWQTALLAPDSEEKVILTVSSEDMLAPLLMANRPFRVVSMANTMKISRRPYACAPAYYAFLDKVRKTINEKEALLNTPCSVRELQDAIYYIEGET